MTKYLAAIVAASALLIACGPPPGVPEAPGTPEVKPPEVETPAVPEAPTPEAPAVPEAPKP